MLTIENLHVNIGPKKILQGINLTIKPGEVHAIMGPNGSGKSTLTNVLAGSDGYEVMAGKIEFDGINILTLAIEERAAMGLFLGLQNPVEIPGVNNLYFLRTALNSVRKKQNKNEIDAFDFTSIVKEKMRLLNLDDKFLERAVNDGFSGGEKKRNEILQMLILEPRLIVLDEIDSGLDIDALQIVALGVNSILSQERAVLMVTHYQRLLNYIVPNNIHVLSEGRIIASGGKELAIKLEEQGYGWLKGR